MWVNTLHKKTKMEPTNISVYLISAHHDNYTPLSFLDDIVASEEHHTRPLTSTTIPIHNMHRHWNLKDQIQTIELKLHAPMIHSPYAITNLQVNSPCCLQIACRISTSLTAKQDPITELWCSKQKIQISKVSGNNYHDFTKR